MKILKVVGIITAILVALVIILAISLPTILNRIGFHPDYHRMAYDLTGKRH